MLGPPCREPRAPVLRSHPADGPLSPRSLGEDVVGPVLVSLLKCMGFYSPDFQHGELTCLSPEPTGRQGAQTWPRSLLRRPGC